MIRNWRGNIGVRRGWEGRSDRDEYDSGKREAGAEACGKYSGIRISGLSEDSLGFMADAC